MSTYVRYPSSVSFSSVTTDVIPSGDTTVNLGSPSKRYLAGYLFQCISNNLQSSDGFNHIAFTPNGKNSFLANGADGASAVGHSFNVNAAFSTTGAKLATFQNATVDKFGIAYNGTTVQEYTDNSGSPGATTINKATGRAAIASGASSVVVTNSTVAATSVVTVQLETSAAGVGGLVVVPAAGSFTVTSVSGTGVATTTTANTKFSFVVHN